jgi:hypothetical protein
MLILAYAHVTCIFNKVLRNRTKLFYKIFLQNLQNCQVINLCRNGTSKPWVACQTSAKNIHVAQFVKRSFDGSFLKYEFQQLKDTKCSSFTHFSERSTPEGSWWLSIPIVCLPVWPIISLVVNILIIIEFAFAFLKYLQGTWFQLSSQTYKMTRFVRSPIAGDKVPTIEASSKILPIHHHPHIIVRT